ncbi:MAG: hypothetical protein WCH77_14545 [Planctomycetota bacterium]
MIGKTFVRLLGAFVCLTVVAAGWDAEAGWRNRRCCYDSCCYTPCCAPVCETVCEPTCCGSVARCCAPVSYTVVREAVILPSACCASTSTAKETAVAEKTVTPAVKLTSARR